MKVDVRRSIIIHKQLAEQGELSLPAEGECWRNAVYAVLNMMSGEVFYVEGYVHVNGKVIWHGWIEEDGKIIEPTNAPQLDAGPVYKPVSRYSRTMLRYRISQAGEALSLPLTPMEDMGTPSAEAWALTEDAAV